MHVLLTGYNGYLGRPVARALRAGGHTVTGMDCDYYAAGDTAEYLNKDIRDITPGDLAGYDAIVHLAGIAHGPANHLPVSALESVNVSGTGRLLQMARDCGITKFVYASSCSVYGQLPEGAVANEDSPCRPINIYAETKARVEDILIKTATRDFTCVILRPATAFGVGHGLRSDLMLNKMTIAAVNDGKITLDIPPDVMRPIVHVADIAAAFAAGVEHAPASGNTAVFNIGRDDLNLTPAEMAGEVCKEISGCTIDVLPLARETDLRSYKVSFGRAQSGLAGFAADKDARHGILEMVSWLAQQPAEARKGHGGRVRTLKALSQAGYIDDDLRWIKKDKTT